MTSCIFWAWQDNDGYGAELYGVKFICEFEGWVVLINLFGGGSAAIIDFMPPPEYESEIQRLVDCLHDYCNYIGSHQLYVYEDKEN